MQCLDLLVRLTGLIDSVEDGVSGFIVKNKKPEFLANKIIELLDKSQLLEKLQISSLEWSKKFSWQKFGQGGVIGQILF